MGKRQKVMVVKIGGDFIKDTKRIFDAPARAEKEEPELTLYVDSWEQLQKILSKQKMSLLEYLIRRERENDSICETACSLGRKQSNVSRDLKELSKHGLVKLERKGRNVVARPTVRQISIVLE